MKKTALALILSALITFAFSQKNDLHTCQLSETYIDIVLNTKNEIEKLGKEFNIDKVNFDKGQGAYNVRVWLPRSQYEDFAQTGIAYKFHEPERPMIEMATTVEEMLQWNRYPTYGTYIALMDTFQQRFPDLCRIDTILASTPGNHSILAAHITADVSKHNCRPQFFYTSTMHGDEVTGYYCMLRLIDYLLNNYNSDIQAKRIIDNFNLWICPIENPDGTYRTNNNTLGSSPTSTRANKNGVDLNRSYPGPSMSLSELEPEVAAMVAFASNHRFVMSANYHGGSELANYPWDTWRSNQNTHADDKWWEYVSRRYADTVHAHSTYSYFRDENDGIVLGGDWYVVTGSRQDYMNYKQHCREITFEVSTSKAPASSAVDNYWKYNRQAMLNYIEESGRGFYGLVYDATTGKAIENATVFVNNHDKMNSEIITSGDSINYYRPIKGGTYSVTFSAEGYCSDTTDVTAADGAATRIDIALRPYPCDIPDNTDTTDETPEIPNDSTSISDYFSLNHLILYPNPAKDKISLKCDDNSQLFDCQLFDIYGKTISEYRLQNGSIIDLTSVPAGLYFLKIHATDDRERIFKIIKQ